MDRLLGPRTWAEVGSLLDNYEEKMPINLILFYTVEMPSVVLHTVNYEMYYMRLFVALAARCYLLYDVYY